MQHFNTEDLLGVELEDQGGDTAGSHWEAKIMFSDYMIILKLSLVILL